METIFANAGVWILVALCLVQSGIFSGLNLAVFGVSRLKLEVEAETGHEAARTILELRRDSNFLLTTILWGNVAINTLLALASNSVLTGVSAFFFSTIAITFFGEIVPQAYFSRHAMQMVALLAPVLRVYQIILYPVAKPSAMILDRWLGHEGVQYFRESGLREVIRKHIESAESDVDRLEGIGALNFLAIDDISAADEGEILDPRSVISLPVKDGLPVFPEIRSDPDDPFLRRMEASGKKWVIITDPSGHPVLVVDSDGFLRAALFQPSPFDPWASCHRPILVGNEREPLGSVISRLRVAAMQPSDDVIDEDVILVWGAGRRRVITGADILGRLLRGIAHREAAEAEPPAPDSKAASGRSR